MADVNHRIAFFDDPDEATNALALARRYSLMCFIGRSSAEAGARRDLILHYWGSPTGRKTSISHETCTAYDPSQVHVVEKGAKGWWVTDERGLTLTLANQADATAALALATRYTVYCTIGHYDSRKYSDRLDYWK